MRFRSILIWPFVGLTFNLSGCAGTGDMHVDATSAAPAAGIPSPLPSQMPIIPQAAAGETFSGKSIPVAARHHGRPELVSDGRTTGGAGERSAKHRAIQPVSHQLRPAPVHTDSPQTLNATLTLDGRTYRLQLVEDGLPQGNHGGGDGGVRTAVHPIPVAPVVAQASQRRADVDAGQSAPPALTASYPADTIPLNLPTALSMVGGQHPAVGFAQWRVQEAYARLDRAKVLWLPSIRPGFSFHRHDGNLQASNGAVDDINRNSFQYGLGAGAVGAGTTQLPGVAAQFHFADAIFQPAIAEMTAWARGHSADGVVNQQLLNVAVGYLELLDAEQDLRIVEESQNRTADLAKLTRDFAEAGEGLQADADRLQTELILVQDRLASARERAEVASARLAQALSMEAGRRIVPLDPTVVPLELVVLDADKGALISMGLANRPELKEAQALVAVANEEYRRQQYAPFVPSVLLGFSTGGFGGGLGNRLANVDDRYDFDAMATWEVRNLGLGERAARQEAMTQVEQARFSEVRVMDQVAREVSEAHAQLVHRSRRIAITKEAIRYAEDSYERNLRRIRDGLGLPLEVLQSVRALEDARRAYLRAVVDYNAAQFRLQWALGWPVNADQRMPCVAAD